MSIFSCWPSVCFLWRNKCLFRSSAHFLIVFLFYFIFCFLILCWMSCMYILKINPLLIASFANIFSLDCRLSFYFVHGFLCCAKAFKFSYVIINKCIYLRFSFHYSRRWPKKNIAVIYVRVFCLCFSLVGLSYLVLHLGL